MYATVVTWNWNTSPSRVTLTKHSPSHCCCCITPRTPGQVVDIWVPSAAGATVPSSETCNDGTAIIVAPLPASTLCQVWPSNVPAFPLLARTSNKVCLYSHPDYIQCLLSASAYWNFKHVVVDKLR